MRYTVDEAVREELWGKPCYDGVVYYAPKTMKAAGMLITATTQVRTLQGATVNVILTDRTFSKLSKNAQAFFINHEKGHIKNCDSSKIKSQFKYAVSCLLGCPEMERKADAYAAEVMGINKVESAMKEMLKSKIPAIAKFQIVKRYIALQFGNIKE